jgi:ABC-type transporter Mla maintaining outer membrane lipid asymmetry ATPase subunit MlaF
VRIGNAREAARPWALKALGRRYAAAIELFFDESTAGLDPQVRGEIYDIIEELRLENRRTAYPLKLHLSV